MVPGPTTFYFDERTELCTNLRVSVARTPSGTEFTIPRCVRISTEVHWQWTDYGREIIERILPKPDKRARWFDRFRTFAEIRDESREIHRASRAVRASHAPSKTQLRKAKLRSHAHSVRSAKTS